MLSFLLSHKAEILVCLLAVVGAFSVVLKTIAPLTSSDLDDKWYARLEKLIALLEKLSLNVR